MQRGDGACEAGARLGGGAFGDGEAGGDRGRLGGLRGFVGLAAGGERECQGERHDEPQGERVLRRDGTCERD